MPAAVAIPAIIGAAGTVGGALINSSTAGHAADVQQQESQQQLAYLQQQAAQERADKIAADKANYGQYAAREQYLSSLGQILGAPARTIAPPPTYTTVAPSATPGAAPTASAPSSGGSSAALPLGMGAATLGAILAPHLFASTPTPAYGSTSLAPADIEGEE